MKNDEVTFKSSACSNAHSHNVPKSKLLQAALQYSVWLKVFFTYLPFIIRTYCADRFLPKQKSDSNIHLSGKRSSMKAASHENGFESVAEQKRSLMYRCVYLLFSLSLSLPYTHIT